MFSFSNANFLEIFIYLLYLQVSIGDTLRIKLSNHAAEKMVERGISVREVEKAISSGSKYLQKPNKIIAEYGYFRVVYKKLGEVYYIITVTLRW